MMLHVYGGVPPVPAIVCEYAVDTVPAGNGLAVLIVRVGGLIASVYALDAVCGGTAPSCTPTAKLAGPAVVGVPVIAPVEVFSVSPFGSDPAVIAHVYGKVPPVTAMLCEYADDTVPGVRGVVVRMVRGAGLIASENAAEAVCEGVAESCTCTVKL